MVIKGAASTPEGRLADIIDDADVDVVIREYVLSDREYTLSDDDKGILVAALRIVHTAKEELRDEERGRIPKS